MEGRKEKKVFFWRKFNFFFFFFGFPFKEAKKESERKILFQYRKVNYVVEDASDG